MDGVQFEKDLQSLFRAQEALKAIAATAKEARDPLKAEVGQYEERIKEYMQSRKIGELEYEGQVLHCKDVTRGLSLSRKTLLAALAEYYDDEKQAEQVFEGLMEIIGSKEVTVLSKRALKAPKGKAATIKDTDDELVPIPVPVNVTAKLEAFHIGDEPPDVGYDSD